MSLRSHWMTSLRVIGRGSYGKDGEEDQKEGSVSPGMLPLHHHSFTPHNLLHLLSTPSLLYIFARQVTAHSLCTPSLTLTLHSYNPAPSLSTQHTLDPHSAHPQSFTLHTPLHTHSALSFYTPSLPHPCIFTPHNKGSGTEAIE